MHLALENRGFSMDNNVTTTTLAPEPPAPINPPHGSLKAILVLSLFFLTWISSLLAFVVKRFAVEHQSTRNRLVFSLISCVGGGVFMGVLLLDVLPDSVDCVSKAFDMLHRKVDYPIAQLCVAAGFFFVLTIEQTIIYAREKNWIGDAEVERLLDHDDHHHDHNLPDALAEYGSVDENQTDIHFNPEAHSSMRAVLLVLALSLHAVFEGLSLGLIDQPAVLLQVFVGLVIHKTTVGFSLGIRLVQSKLANVHIMLCCLIFAAQVLVGGFFGLGIMKFMDSSSQGTTHLVSGILQACAAGTFLYVVTFEILPHELNQRGHRPGKLLALLAGFAVIAVFIAVFPDADTD